MIEAYSGITNLLDHRWTFIELMRLCATLDAVMCRSFPPTLRWEAKDWVAILAPWSIRTFDEPFRIFVAYFLSSRRKMNMAIGLIYVIQEKNESL